MEDNNLFSSNKNIKNQQSDINNLNKNPEESSKIFTNLFKIKEKENPEFQMEITEELITLWEVI